MIEKYKKYLDKIGVHLQKFFAQQQPYIFCKEGCSICCETGEYPFTKVEFEYAMIGFETLSAEEKEIVREKVKKIKKAKEEAIKKTPDKKFMHACPFLIDKKCSIYNYRGIICRSHGLVSFSTDQNDKTVYNMPRCVDSGLNYSNVYDRETNTISSKMWKETGIEEEPVSYNIGLKFLLDNKTTKDLELDFGERRAIINFFE